MVSTSDREDAELRERIESLARALRAKDVQTLMSHYADSNVTFDLRPPLQVQGADAYRRNFEAWFASVRGPIGFEIHDLRIATGSDVAFCHYLGHVESTRVTGDRADYWVRVTAGFRKLNGHWKITHEHVSLPFDMETGEAAFDLRP